MKLHNYLIILKALLLSLILFFFTRVGFLFYNYSYFESASFGEMILPLLYGLRFDLSVTLIVNTPFIILSLIPINNMSYRIFKRIVYTLLNFLFLGLCIADFDYFNFTGKKLTQDILLLGGDVSDQADQLIMTHWDLALCALAVFIPLIVFYPKNKLKSSRKPKIGAFKVLIIGLLSLVVTFIGIRGGLQMRSISPKAAFIFDKYELGNLALNSAYSFIRSMDEEGSKPINYFKDDKEALKYIKGVAESLALNPNYPGHNVVVIILESFSQEYIEDGYAPYFSELTKEGLYFSENYANGRRSIDALPSILTGIPALLGQPVSQSKYQTNQFYSMPKILKEIGYDTSFYHGGKKGTMDFDAYTRSIGITDYYSKDEYPNQSHFDGHWGIYDHHYLNYFVDELDQKPKPFFSAIFTLSSHEPYSIPAEFQNKYPKGVLPIHESIGYVDESLKIFFKKVMEKEWAQKTLFIITGDHTQKLHTKKFNSVPGKFRVPLLIYHPSVDLSMFDNTIVTQHVDIPATVLDFLGAKNGKNLYFGSSIFDFNHKSQMLNLSSERYIYYTPKVMVGFDGLGTQIYDVDWDSTEVLKMREGSQETPELKTLKAYIQYFHNGLQKNNIYKIGE